MMKKITLIMSLFFGLTLNSQVLFEDDGTTNRIAEYTTIDEDGRVIAPFLTDQGVFTDGTWGYVNFGEPLGQTYYSSSSFTAADSCLATEDFLILPVLDFTTALSTPEITLSSASSEGSGEISVFVTNSIVGTTPVASDFTGAALGTLSLTGDYQEQTFDLTTMSGSATVYIAIVNSSAVCSGIIAVKDIKVRNYGVKGITLTDLNIIDQDFSNASLAYKYSVTDCGTTTTPLVATIVNEGTAPLTDTVIVSYEYNTTLAIVTITDTILDFTTTPLASGATHLHTFSEDMDFSNVDVTVLIATAVVSDDFDDSNDEIGHIFASPNAHDLSAGQYDNSFELDFADAGILANTLATMTENNGAQTEWSIQDYSIYGDAADFVSDGINVMEHGYTGAGATYPASDNWVFTPCITFDDSKAYTVSFDYNTIQGSVAPHTLNFLLTNDYTSASAVQTVASGVLGAETLTRYSNQFTVTTSGDYHFAIQDASTLGFILTMDMLTIKELPTPTAPTITPTWEPCTTTASINFSYDSENTYEINWGDGNTEVVTTGNPTHVYVASATPYTANIEVSNLAGTDDADFTVNATMLPTPDATFSFIQSAPTDVTIDFTAQQTYACYTYDWNFGDNTEHAAGSSANHEYLANGTYTVTLFIQDPASGENSSKTQEITITGIGLAIDQIDFVNGIKVFPNPVNDELNINFELNSVQNVAINLQSTDGKIVNSITSNTANVMETMNTSKLSTGLYILSVTTEAGKFTTNVVVK